MVEDSATGVAAGRAAGATVWAVNAASPVPNAHHVFVTLAEASPHIINFCLSAP